MGCWSGDSAARDDERIASTTRLDAAVGGDEDVEPPRAREVLRDQDAMSARRVVDADGDSRDLVILEGCREAANTLGSSVLRGWRAFQDEQKRFAG